nr:gustatory receptor 46.1 [Papilio polytes]
MLKSKVVRSNKSSAQHNTDFVLDNFLETEVKTILLPLYVAQCLTLAPKYSIRYGLITSNSRKFNAFVCLLGTGVLAAWLYYLIDYWSNSSGLLAATIITYSVPLTTAFLLNTIITTAKSNNYALLIITLQRILKRFKFSKIDRRNVTKLSWVYVVFIITFNIIHFVFRLDDSNGISILKMFTQFIYVSFDCNAIICMRMINLLGKCIETWVSELHCLCQKYDRAQIEMDNSPLKTVIRDYNQLIEILQIYCQVYKYTIFLMVVTSFFQVLVNVQSMLLVKVWTSSSILAPIVWLKNILLLTFLSSEAENVYLQMKNFGLVCLLISIKEKPSDQHLDLRSVVRCQIYEGESWRSGNGPLPVDAALPPRFLAVVATYVVVILQFHFL